MSAADPYRVDGASAVRLPTGPAPLRSAAWEAHKIREGAFAVCARESCKEQRIG